MKRRYGICYADGRIRIRLHQVRGSDVLKYSVMVDTLCHELAHLRHFNHGRRFWQFYRRILAYAARQGIYRPGPGGVAHAADAVPGAAGLDPERQSPGRDRPRASSTCSRTP